jgi:hypothetical protein
MVNVKECDRSQILHGSSWIFQKVYCRVLEDSSPYHFFAKEGEKFLVDK